MLSSPYEFWPGIPVLSNDRAETDSDLLSLPEDMQQRLLKENIRSDADLRRKIEQIKMID